MSQDMLHRRCLQGGKITDTWKLVSPVRRGGVEKGQLRHLVGVLLYPHQGHSCRNRPPSLAHPVLPSLPPLPEYVDPDAWLQAIHGRTYARRVKSDGRLTRGWSQLLYPAGIGWTSGHGCRVNAAERCFEVIQQESLIKQLPIKELQGKLMPLDNYIALMEERARSEERQRLMKLRQRYLQAR